MYVYIYTVCVFSYFWRPNYYEHQPKSISRHGHGPRYWDGRCLSSTKGSKPNGAHCPFFLVLPRTHSDAPLCCLLVYGHPSNYSFRIAKPQFTQLQTTLQILAGMQIASTLEPSNISLLIGYEQGTSGLSTYQVCLALCKYILVYPRQYRPRINNHCWFFLGAFPKTPW